MVWEPNELIDSATVRLKPWMMLAMATTVATPIRTPSKVSPERRRLLRSERSAMRKTVGARAKDRKSTRLNSSHSQISYAVFCLKKKKKRSTKIYTGCEQLRSGEGWMQE